MNTRERETAIEDRLSRASEANYGGDREMFDLARDLVRCWREYLAAHDTLSEVDTPEARFAAACETRERVEAEARALLARGDEQ